MQLAKPVNQTVFFPLDGHASIFWLKDNKSVMTLI